jgi:small GTP-binding protein
MAELEREEAERVRLQEEEDRRAAIRLQQKLKADDELEQRTRTERLLINAEKDRLRIPETLNYKVPTDKQERAAALHEALKLKIRGSTAEEKALGELHAEQIQDYDKALSLQKEEDESLPPPTSETQRREEEKARLAAAADAPAFSDEEEESAVAKGEREYQARQKQRDEERMAEERTDQARSKQRDEEVKAEEAAWRKLVAAAEAAKSEPDVVAKVAAWPVPTDATERKRAMTKSQMDSQSAGEAKDPKAMAVEILRQRKIQDYEAQQQAAPAVAAASEPFELVLYKGAAGIATHTVPVHPSTKIRDLSFMVPQEWQMSGPMARLVSPTKRLLDDGKLISDYPELTDGAVVVVESLFSVSSAIPEPSALDVIAPDTTYKICIIGDAGVGKTSLLLRYVDGTFPTTFMPTIDVNPKSKDITLANGKRVRLQIWDTAGAERFRTITSNYYRGAAGVMVVFDVTDRASFNQVRQWNQEIDRYAIEGTPRTLVTNKMDIVAGAEGDPSKAAVTEQEVKALADELGMQPVWATSAKTGQEVENAFLKLAEKIAASTTAPVVVPAPPPPSATLDTFGFGHPIPSLGEITVHIRKPAGGELHLNVRPSDTVLSLKTRVEQNTGISVATQLLSLSTDPTHAMHPIGNNSQTLTQAGVVHDTLLWLANRPIEPVAPPRPKLPAFGLPAPGDGEIAIAVIWPIGKGQTLHYNVNPQITTVLQLQQLVANDLALPVDDIVLLFGTNYLTDANQTLADAGISLVRPDLSALPKSGFASRQEPIEPSAVVPRHAPAAKLPANEREELLKVQYDQATTLEETQRQLSATRVELDRKVEHARKLALDLDDVTASNLQLEQKLREARRPQNQQASTKQAQAVEQENARLVQELDAERQKVAQMRREVDRFMVQRKQDAEDTRGQRAELADFVNQIAEVSAAAARREADLRQQLGDSRLHSAALQKRVEELSVRFDAPEPDAKSLWEEIKTSPDYRDEIRALEKKNAELQQEVETATKQMVKEYANRPDLSVLPSSLYGPLQQEITTLQQKLRDQDMCQHEERLSNLEQDAERQRQLLRLQEELSPLRQQVSVLERVNRQHQQDTRELERLVGEYRNSRAVTDSQDKLDQLERKLEQEYRDKLKAALAAATTEQDSPIVVLPASVGEAQVLVRQRGHSRLEAVKDQVQLSLEALRRRVQSYVASAAQILEQGPLTVQGLRTLLALQSQYVQDMGGERDSQDAGNNERTWVWRFQSPADGMEAARVLRDELGFPDTEVMYAPNSSEQGRRVRVRITGASDLRTSSTSTASLNLSLDHLQRRAMDLLSKGAGGMAERRMQAGELVARYFSGDARGDGLHQFDNQTRTDQANRMLQLLGVPHRSRATDPVFSVRVLGTFDV